MLIHFNDATKAGATPLMYLMQRMGGFTATHFNLQLNDTNGKTCERPADIDAGYDFGSKMKHPVNTTETNRRGGSSNN